MTNMIWKRDEVESPCVQICVMHPAEGLCTGCYRKLEEITRWSAMDSSERAALLQELPNRAPRLAKRRGGRAARQKK